MLDVKFIVENADAVRKNCLAKNERKAQIDRILELYDQKRKLQQSVDAARTKINQISEEIGAIKK